MNKKKDFFSIYLPPALIYGAILFLSSRPRTDFPAFKLDMIPHFVEYVFLAYFFIRVFRRPVGKALFVFCVVFLLALAFLDESFQYFVPTRIFSLMDVFYDLLGILTGLLLYSFKSKRVSKSSQDIKSSQAL